MHANNWHEGARYGLALLGDAGVMSSVFMNPRIRGAVMSPVWDSGWQLSLYRRIKASNNRRHWFALRLLWLLSQVARGVEIGVQSFNQLGCGRLSGLSGDDLFFPGKAKTEPF